MPMYGDLMHSALVPCVLPYLIVKLMGENECPTVTTITITFLWFLSGCLTSISWFTNGSEASFAAALFILVLNVFIIITGWPEPNDDILLSSYVAPFVISVLNTETTVYQKCSIGFLNFISTCLSVQFSASHEMRIDDQLPLLVLGFFLTNLWIFLVPDLSHPRVPRILLVVWCAYEIVDELSRASMASAYKLDPFRLARTLFPIASTLAALNALQRKTKELKIVGRALDACKAPVGVIDEASRVLWVNPALEVLFSGKELLGRPLCEVVGSQIPTSGKPVTMIEDSMELGEVTIGGLTYRIEVSNAEEPTREASSMGSVVVFRDITEEKRREQAQRDATREKLKQEATVRSVEQLGHELRTPLQSILSTGTLLQDKAKNLGNELGEMAQTVLASGQHLLLLIENASALHGWARNEEAEVILQSTPLEPILESALSVCKPLASISGVAIDPPVMSESNFHLLANTARLQLIMTNCLCNSINRSSPGSNVTLEATTLGKQCIQQRLESATEIFTSGFEFSSSDKEDFVVVSVTNERIGSAIPKDENATVQGSINVLKRSRSYVPFGNGLGLATSAKLLETMRGSMWTTKNEQSARLSFLLPQCGPPQLTLRQIIPSISELQSLLVVDDTLVNLKLMARVLQRGGIPDVATAASGHEALRLLEKRSFDVVLSDFHMPSMNGAELGAAILSKNLPSQPLVICISAGLTEEMKSVCRSSGIFHVLHKPLTPLVVSQIRNDLWKRHSPTDFAARDIETTS